MKYLNESKIEKIKRYLEFSEYEVEPRDKMELEDENPDNAEQSGLTVIDVNTPEYRETPVGLHKVK